MVFPIFFQSRFSKDDVENYFSRQRATGQRCDNPTVQDFRYNDNTIKLQYLVRPIAENVWGLLQNSMKLLQSPYQNRSDKKWQFS